MRTVAACLIVRNESKVIQRCLDSLVGLVDQIAIVDTGSTDDTLRVIEGLPYRPKIYLNQRPWVNFGHNRTELVRLASPKADYLLMVDADQTAHGSFPVDLTADAYRVALQSGALAWDNTLLIRSALPWRYVGVTHEYLTCDQQIKTERLEGFSLTEHADGGDRPPGYQPRWEWDAAQLEREVAKPNPSPRDVFYLARTYDDLAATRPADPRAGDWRGQAIRRYSHRSQMAGGYQDEAWWSLYRLGALTVDGGGLTHLLTAFDRQPHRWEPVWEACQHLNRQSRYQLSYALSRHCLTFPPKPEGLFVRLDVYDYLLAFEHSISSHWVGRYQESYDVCRQLLAVPNLPAEIVDALRRNIAYPAERLGIRLVA